MCWGVAVLGGGGGFFSGLGYQKFIQKCQKLVKNQSWRVPGGSSEALGGQYQKMKVPLGFSGPSWGRLGGLLGRLGGRLGPSWRSWRPLVRLKIHAKIDRKSDASWNRCLGGFW